jgi:hypothetical protein
LARYRELRDFYEGVQWLGRPRRSETRLVINYARALVRKVVSYALPARVGFSVPAPVLVEGDREEGGSGDSRTEDGGRKAGSRRRRPISCGRGRTRAKRRRTRSSRC